MIYQIYPRSFQGTRGDGIGDLQGLIDRLVEAAHARGLRVTIDQVLSHTSDAHPWFQESRSSRDNPKADWYVWADPRPDGNPPNNWLAAFGGRAWTFDVIRHDGEQRLLCLAHLDHATSDREEINLDALIPGADGWSNLALPGMATPLLEGQQLIMEPGQAAWLSIV